MIQGKNIGIDFDESLCKEVCWTENDVKNATPRQDFIDHVNRLSHGNTIIIYTARKDELIPESLKWLRRYGVRFHAISNNKVALDYYLDDKSVHIDDIHKL